MKKKHLLLITAVTLHCGTYRPQTQALPAQQSQKLAAALKIKPPSRYKHVADIDDIVDGIGVRGANMLVADLSPLRDSKNPQRAFMQACEAYRKFSMKNATCDATGIVRAPFIQRSSNSAGAAVFSAARTVRYTAVHLRQRLRHSLQPAGYGRLSAPRTITGLSCSKCPGTPGVQ